MSFKTPEGLSHLDGEPTYAQALIGCTHVTGMTVSTAGSCDVAGQAGTTSHGTRPKIHRNFSGFSQPVDSIAVFACVGPPV